MPSPFHQKYATQTHRVFTNDTTTNTMPTMPDPPATEKKPDPASPPLSPTERRRSSGTMRYANLYALKRPEGDDEGAKRRASLTDARIGQPGVFGTWWNNFTRGTTNPNEKK